MELDRIIKAMECCHLNKEDCPSCPFVFLGESCTNLESSAVSLIKELSEANDKLYNDNERLREIITEGVKLAKEELVEQIKTDTVRKMQDKILAKSEYGTINISPWQLDRIAREVLEENRSYSWVITENGCVITCPICGERLELCYPDGTEVRYLPHCPWCGKRLEEQ